MDNLNLALSLTHYLDVLSDWAAGGNKKRWVNKKRLKTFEGYFLKIMVITY